MIDAGHLLADKYRLERSIGAGGMGQVFAATNLHTGRKVAIKVIHPEHAKTDEVVARFMQEARAATRARHPNIVDVLDLDAYCPPTVLAMPQAMARTVEPGARPAVYRTRVDEVPELHGVARRGARGIAVGLRAVRCGAVGRCAVDLFAAGCGAVGRRAATAGRCAVVDRAVGHPARSAAPRASPRADSRPAGPREDR